MISRLVVREAEELHFAALHVLATAAACVSTAVEEMQVSRLLSRKAGSLRSGWAARSERGAAQNQQNQHKILARQPRTGYATGESEAP